jgi:signal transduction histidine kinase
VTPRTAKIVSRSILAIAVALMATSLIVALATFDRQEPGTIVVVPAERADGIRAAAGALDPDRNCEGNVRTSPLLGDAPRVYCELEVRRRAGDAFLAAWADGVVGFLVGFLWLGTGTLIVSRQPRNTAGWIFMTIGLFFVAEWASLAFLVAGIKVDPASIPVLGLWAVLAEYALLPIASISLLFLLYPDGRPPTPRWRWAEWALFLGVTVAIVSFAVDPGPLNNLVEVGILYLNPIGVPALTGTAGTVAAVGTIIAFVASLSTVLAVRARFKRSTGEVRQQMRWLVFVATAAGIVFLVLALWGSIVAAFIGDDEPVRVLGVDPLDALWIVLALVLAFGIPAAYLIAIFKHGLWNLDVVIKKALVAFVLTLLLAGIGLVVLGILGAFAVWTGAGVVVGVIAGLLAWPVVRFSRSIARRLVFGRRADPYAVLTEFSGRVGETYATEDILPRMARLLAEGTGASRARVLLMVGSELIEGARWPAGSANDGGEHVVPVVDRGEELGALTVTMPANDPMNPAKEKLVRDLAGQAGLVLRNVRLIEELRASRRRLVAAQDAERRRLERNIHDGAQQQLVALKVKQRLVQGMIERDPTKALELMTQLQVDTTEALDDLRDLARGIYPPLLADQGLGAALESQARKSPVPISVETDGVERYPQDVEAAVYFCALEALNNLAKYASASRATVALAQTNGTLTFAVSDDGVGFSVGERTSGGTGLQGMSDRLDAIGGALEIRSAPGEGTTVLGRIPVR